MLAMLGSFTSRSLTKKKQGPESFMCNPWPILLANDGKSRAQLSFVLSLLFVFRERSSSLCNRKCGWVLSFSVWLDFVGTNAIPRVWTGKAQE